MMHLMPFTCHILITAAAIFYIIIFFHPRPVMVDIVRSLPPEPAVLCAHALHERRWVGPRLRARLVGGAWAYLWLHTRDLVLLVCL